MSIVLFLASLSFAPTSHAMRANACVRALVRGLHVVETRKLARQRLDRAAGRANFTPLDAGEFDLVREIERKIRPYFFVPGEIVERLFRDYNGPRELFARRLQSTAAWLSALEDGQMAPVESELHPFTEFKWSLLEAAGAKIHRVAWTNFGGHTGLIEHPHAVPSATLAEDSWPGQVPLDDLIADHAVPIESFVGVIYPWPVLVIGRMTEHHLLDQQLDHLNEKADRDRDVAAIFFAINHHVLEAMVAEYESLIADHPEFRSKHFDEILEEGAYEGIRHVLRRDYLDPDPRYVDVVKPPARE